jgi:hypothetical protein
MRSPRSFLRDQRGNIAAGAAKFVIAVGFLSLVALNMTGNNIGQAEKDRIAALAGLAVDSRATGSLARDVNATKLDPCALPPR